MKDIEYIFNNKIYNITKSAKLYEYVEKEGTGRFIGSLEMLRDVNVEIYKSLKGNLYKTVSKMGRIAITDITEEDLKELFFKRNELSLLRELFPSEVDKLEEV